MAARLQVAFDCADTRRQAAFWAEVLGYKLEDPPEGFDSWEAWADAQGIPEEHRDSAAAIVDPDGIGPRMYFQKVPEGKTAKNRVHLDVHTVDRDAPLEQRRTAAHAEAERLVALGATRLEAHEEFGVYWIVLQDPEGNEFCVH